MDLNNQKRLVASQIIVELYEAKQDEQLQILGAQITAALEKLGIKPAATNPRNRGHTP